MDATNHAMTNAQSSQSASDHRPNLPHQNASQHHRHSASPAPVQNQHLNHAASSHASQHSQTAAISSRHDQYATPQRNHAHQQAPSRSTPHSAPSADGQRQPEVFMLDHAPNAAIPEAIRKQFQQNEDGRVLFFSTPPQERHQLLQSGAAIGHSARYMATKLRRQLLEKKRKAEEGEKSSEDVNGKRTKMEADGQKMQKTVKQMTDDALQALIKQMDEGTDQIWKNMYGSEWEAGKTLEAQHLHERQARAAAAEAELAESRRKRAERERIPMKRDIGLYLDDYDPRY